MFFDVNIAFFFPILRVAVRNGDLATTIAT
jgi:hypothetical protein